MAHHSGARVEARLRGLTGFEDEFPYLDSPLDQALTYCDLTTSPDGHRVTLTERLAEITTRYGPTHTVSRAMQRCKPELERACFETEQRLTSGEVVGGRRLSADWPQATVIDPDGTACPYLAGQREA